MKTYEGKRECDVVIVLVDGQPLNPRLDLWKHSPTGFEWGYAGSGPAQLALAILADYLNDEFKAVELHQEFKQNVIAHLPHAGWTLTSDQVRSALAAMKALPSSSTKSHDRPVTP